MGAPQCPVAETAESGGEDETQVQPHQRGALAGLMRRTENTTSTLPFSDTAYPPPPAPPKPPLRRSPPKQ